LDRRLSAPLSPSECCGIEKKCCLCWKSNPSHPTLFPLLVPDFVNTNMAMMYYVADSQGTISRQHINIYNNNDSRDSSFLIRAEFQTPDDGHFRPKHVVKGF
jgi:hypothetical protein